MKNRPRTIHTAYLYWLIGGALFGWHRLYLRDSAGWFYYISTVGGFGISAIKDLLRMSTAVAKWNKEAFPNELSLEDNYLNDADNITVLNPPSYGAHQKIKYRSISLIALKTYVTCLWYDWLLSKFILFITRPLMSTVFSYFIHRLLRPVVISVGIALANRRTDIFNGVPWWKLLCYVTFGDYSREILYQVFEWKILSRTSPALPFLCMSLSKFFNSSIDRGILKGTPSRISSCGIYSLTILSVFWYTSLVTVLIREAEIPIAILDTTVYWDKVYRLIGPVDSIKMQNNSNGLQWLRHIDDDIYDISTDFKVPFKVVLTYLTSTCIENGLSLIHFWKSIPDRAHSPTFNRRDGGLYGDLELTDDDFDLNPAGPILSNSPTIGGGGGPFK